MTRLNGAGGVWLVPQETTHLADGEYRAVQVEVNESPHYYRYWLSTRLIETQSLIGVSPVFERGDLFIHQPELHWQTPKSKYLGTVAVGESKTLPGGVTVHNDAFDGLRSQIRVSVNGNHGSMPPEPEPYTLDSGDPIGPEHSALWWAPEYPQQGFDFTFRDGQFIGYFYGYEPEPRRLNPSQWSTGKRWQILDGHVSGDVLEFDVFEAPGGESVKTGTGRLAFYGDEAQVILETSTYGREAYSLQRLSPPKTNARLLASGNNQGVSLAEYNGKTVGYWYGHAANGLIWYLLDGGDVIDVSALHRQSEPSEPKRIGGFSLSGDDLTILGNHYTVQEL
jgi:hypothetical protein